MIDTQQIADRLKAAEQAHRLPEQVASELLAAQTQGELVTVPVLKSELNALELRLTKEINVLRDSLSQKINGIWIPIGVLALITWILQVFGSSLRVFFHWP